MKRLSVCMLLVALPACETLPPAAAVIPPTYATGIAAGTYTGKITSRLIARDDGVVSGDDTTEIDGLVQINDQGQLLSRSTGQPVGQGTQATYTADNLTVTKTVTSADAVGDVITVNGEFRITLAQAPGTPALGTFTMTYTLAADGTLEYAEEATATTPAGQGTVFSFEFTWNGTLTK